MEQLEKESLWQLKISEFIKSNDRKLIIGFEPDYSEDIKIIGKILESMDYLKSFENDNQMMWSIIYKKKGEQWLIMRMIFGDVEIVKK